MDAKIKACSKLQQIEEKRRDQAGQALAKIQQQHTHLENQHQQLSMLKADVSQKMLSQRQGNSMVLMNYCGIDHMLQKMLIHSEQEQAVLTAQTHAMEKALNQQQARVQQIEHVVERWQKKQAYEKAKKEQKWLEEMINVRIKKKEKI